MEDIKKFERIKLPIDQDIKEINVDNGYKYLEILEADGIKDKEMKEKIRKKIYKTCTAGSQVKT